MLIGYARAPTHDQTLTLQKDVLQKAGCDNIFTDIAGGGKTKRKGLDKALSSLRPGDTFVVCNLSQISHSIKELTMIMTMLAEEGIGFKSLTEDIDTTTKGGKQIFRIFGALRAVMREKTKPGLRVARAKGRKGGRPKLLTPEEVTLLQELYDNEDISIPEICQQLQISKMTLYRYVKPRDKQQPGLKSLVHRLRGLGKR
jgi:DNA invertase Pin-like site-specific DNA recombinase